MINLLDLEKTDFQDIQLREKLAVLYSAAGVPTKYHFNNLNDHWSQNYSPNGALTGVAKKRSEMVYEFTKSYLEAMEGILNGYPLKVKFKKQTVLVTDVFFDGGKGSGKTFILSVLAQRAINMGFTAKFVSWASFVDSFLTFDSMKENEKLFQDCMEVDLLIFDSVFDYDINNNKFFSVKLDNLISSRTASNKITICSIDTTYNQNPSFGYIWNKFSRETFTIKLPGATNENKSTRART